MKSGIYEIDMQFTLFDPADHVEVSVKKKPKRRLTQQNLVELIAVPIQVLDLTPGHGDLMGDAQWEIRAPYLEDGTLLNTGVAPRNPAYASLSDILEPQSDPKYYLSKTACSGILRRADEREKELPEELKGALMAQAGLAPIQNMNSGLKDYHINQRDEGIDLGEVSGALMAIANVQMQTFITAAFSAGQGAKAGGIGYQEECAPTLKATESGSNMVPTVLCLNDQGGSVMECTEDMTGTLRAQEHGHQALVFENHGIDSRYTGPHEVAPTMSARYGTGGNNIPLVAQEETPVICITGNAIDRQPLNGGNGIGYQEDISYTLTATDHHAVFSRQRVDVFKDDDVVSTQSARQHKAATDLIYQESVGALTSSDRKGPNSQYVSQDKLIVETPLLIRRLTPLECERLQGFPDGWTDIPGASDSARYKALGNSVAIPCVDFVLGSIANILRTGNKKEGDYVDLLPNQ